jgi:hypothetical protein
VLIFVIAGLHHVTAENGEVENTGLGIYEENQLRLVSACLENGTERALLKSMNNQVTLRIIRISEITHSECIG